MAEPTIVCPNCKTEIKLTESLAAPLIDSIRRDYEKLLAQKDADVAKRATALREREETLSKAQQAIDDQVAEKLMLERAKMRLRNRRRQNWLCKRTLTRRRENLPNYRTSSVNANTKLAEAQKGTG